MTCITCEARKCAILGGRKADLTKIYQQYSVVKKEDQEAKSEQVDFICVSGSLYAIVLRRSKDLYHPTQYPISNI
jgi:hypothetical protein